MAQIFVVNCPAFSSSAMSCLENFKQHQRSRADEFPMNWFYSINNLPNLTNYALNIELREYGL